MASSFFLFLFFFVFAAYPPKFQHFVRWLMCRLLAIHHSCIGRDAIVKVEYRTVMFTFFGGSGVQGLRQDDEQVDESFELTHNPISVSS